MLRYAHLNAVLFQLRYIIFTGCLQLLELLEFLEISWILIDGPGKCL